MYTITHGRGLAHLFDAIADAGLGGPLGDAVALCSKSCVQVRLAEAPRQLLFAATPSPELTRQGQLLSIWQLELLACILPFGLLVNFYQW